MHEASLVQSMLDIVRQEMHTHGLTRLTAVKVVCGRLSGVVPDALHMAFQAMTRQTELDNASLDLEIVPLRLRCAQCGNDFCPEQEDCGSLAVFAPCPFCGQDAGHRILCGQELNIEHIEAE
ncbi:hydrogenase maturation nickel metallochaperone HypA [Desulfovermiculus halophilus]|uniref:hydrogenase maturation nickel metallochaperone HypA/HybF n=1 Tax=Desulfovermiculus halophilus TaxID=339722 RepID=UPI000489883B|nr:hydrogenase maturation nickel metallochaperone HypA [Desulfovermiculus halophilus]